MILQHFYRLLYYCYCMVVASLCEQFHRCGLPEDYSPLKVGPLKSSYGVWGSAVSPPSGVRAEPRPQTHFWHILSLGNASEGNNFDDSTVFLPTLYYCFISGILHGCTNRKAKILKELHARWPLLLFVTVRSVIDVNVVSSPSW